MDNVQRALPFSVEQSVVHTDFGSCTITDIKTVLRGGHCVEVYVLQFPKRKLTMEVATKGTGADKLRTITTTVTPAHILAILQKPPRGRPKQMWSRRAKNLAEDIRSGDITRVAGVVNQLYPSPENPRSYSELQLYQEALHMVCGELGLMTGKTEAEVVDYLTQQCPEKSFKLTSYTPYATAKSGSKKYTPPPEESRSKNYVPWSSSQHLPQKKEAPPKQRRMTQPKASPLKPRKTARGNALARTESVQTVTLVTTTIVAPQTSSLVKKVPPPKVRATLKSEIVQPAAVTTNSAEEHDRFTTLTEELATERKQAAALAKDHARIVREIEARAVRVTTRAERAETQSEALRNEARDNRTQTALRLSELADDVETERGRIRIFENIIAELKRTNSPEAWAEKEAAVKKLKRDLQSVRAQHTKAAKKKDNLTQELKSARKELQDTAAKLQQLHEQAATRPFVPTPLVAEESLIVSERDNALKQVTSLLEHISQLEAELKTAKAQLGETTKNAQKDRTRSNTRVRSLEASLQTKNAAFKAAKAELITAVTINAQRIEVVRTELMSDIARRITASEYETAELARLRKLYKKP